jgi:hypothetical protein
MLPDYVDERILKAILTEPENPAIESLILAPEDFSCTYCAILHCAIQELANYPWKRNAVFLASELGAMANAAHSEGKLERRNLYNSAIYHLYKITLSRAPQEDVDALADLASYLREGRWRPFRLRARLGDDGTRTTIVPPPGTSS